MSCVEIFEDLGKIVSEINNKFIDDFTNQNMEFMLSCVKTNITHDKYYNLLKEGWESKLSDIKKSNEACSSKLKTILKMSSIVGKEDLNIPLQDIVIDSLISYVFSDEKQFEMSDDVIKTMKNLSLFFVNNCTCQILEIFKYFISKYKVKFQPQFEKMTKEEKKKYMIHLYNKFKDIIFNSNKNITNSKENLMNDIASKITNMYGFSIGNELERLIPNELGSMKQFFIKIISTYYNSLHPIIWAQMFRRIMEEIFIALPLTSDEIFQFVSKQILLNSGPFILKILQMIRPVLTPELATKYNLTKLTYPLLNQKQVEIILNKIVNEPTLIKINRQFSASVGHVCLANKVNNPNDLFIIKIIKPLSIAQSCWEYKILHNIFPKGSCEEDFVVNMLKSNGKEMNVLNEIENIKKGSEYYSCKYQEVFGIEYDVSLNTVEQRTDVTKDGTWFAFTMTLAPGLPLSELVENNQLIEDTKYRSILHRCLDLLVYKFFFNLISTGFYHGDLHAGNIFFSYQQRKMTLIDFGAVGEIELFSGDTAILEFLDIIIMSLFYNYVGIFDKMTLLLNSRCIETQVDMKTPEYNQFKQELLKYQNINRQNSEKEKRNLAQYNNDIFSSKRINDENQKSDEKMMKKYIEIDSIYSLLDVKQKEKEIIIENKDILPKFTEILGDSESVSFSKILEMIIKFYSSSGVNVAIKFSQFYELQKAYALILGVLNKAGYNSYRANLVMSKAIKNTKHLPKISKLNTVISVIKTYLDERKKYKGQMNVSIPTNNKIVDDIKQKINNGENTNLNNFTKEEKQFINQILKMNK